jgi:hypothetical protein
MGVAMGGGELSEDAPEEGEGSLAKELEDGIAVMGRLVVGANVGVGSGLAETLCVGSAEGCACVVGSGAIGR